jgi:hypothetical protein
MNVSEAGRKRTSELVDQVAHDAHIVDAEHHVPGRALMKSGRTMHAERNDDHGPASAGMHVTADTVLEAIAVGAEQVHAAKCEVAAEGVALLLLTGSIVYAGYDAKKKAGEIRAAFDNDAVNCALAGNLAFNPAFAALEQHARPGVTLATGELSRQLQDNPIRAVLQARADEGYLAAEHAVEASKHLPVAERPAAIARWLTDHYPSRLADDVAFAKGVEYHAFVTAAAARGLYGVNAEAELAKVDERAPLERPLMVQP